MRSLLIAVALVACSFAYKGDSNIISEQAVEAFGNTCGECKSVVRSFMAAIDDPTKLIEIKAHLSAACKGIKYEPECKLIVNKIDVFTRKFQRFVGNEEAACMKMRMCGNDKLTTFHRIGLLFLKNAMERIFGKDSTNGVICEECQLAAIEFKRAIEDFKDGAAIKAFISENMCKNIPKFQSACDMMLEDFMPEIWQTLDALMENPNRACAQVRLCAKQADLTSIKASSKQTLASFWKKSKHMNTHSGAQILMSCFECKVLIDALAYDIEEPEHFNALGDLLRDWACPQLPDSLQAGCVDFLTLYASTVVYVTASQLDAEGICTKYLHACDASSMMSLRQMNKAEIDAKKCDACTAFTAFLKHEIGQPDFMSDLVAAVNGHVCSNLSGFSGLCENFAESYLPLFAKRITQLLETGAVCTKIAHVC